MDGVRRYKRRQRRIMKYALNPKFIPEYEYKNYMLNKLFRYGIVIKYNYFLFLLYK